MTSFVVIATLAENKMASRKAKKEKLVNKTPEVTQVDDQLKEKEIIPGKGFYESHWLKLMEKESNDSYIQSLTDEIFETAFAKGNHTLCNAQAFPHSVQWAKSKMIEVIECYFLSHDMGQSKIEEDVWTEDPDPPITAVIDSWARGMMPLQTVDISPKKSSFIALVPIPEEEAASKEIPPALESALSHHSEPMKREESGGSSRMTKLNPSEKTNTRSRPVKRRQKQPVMTIVEKPSPETQIDETLQSQSQSSTFHSHTPPTPTSHMVVPSAITTTSPLPPPSSPRQTVRCARGLKTQSFPSQCIKPQVRISQTAKTLKIHEQDRKQPKTTKKDSTPQHHYSHHHHKRHMAKWTTRPDVSIASGTGQQQGKGGLQRLNSSRYPKRPVLPFLVDLIDPVPGVSVKADGRFLTSSTLVRAKLPNHHGPMKPMNGQKLVNATNSGLVTVDDKNNQP